MCDTPALKAITESLLVNASDDRSKARLLANSSKETGAWLNALPIASCGLRMDHESIRVAVGLRLGAPLCLPHQCHHCGAEVDCLGMHGLSCRWSEGRFSPHAAINDIIYRSLHSANVPAHLEPTGLYRSDGRRPDGISIIPWKGGKCLLWDATTPDTFAPSHRSVAARGAGEVALQSERLKHAKYSALAATLLFVPVVVERRGCLALRPVNSSMSWGLAWPKYRWSQSPLSF